uniref:Uncharacterized protein n=1 Tax=Magallana gigas TaxID=29159 RepID=K1QKN7_MAGGI
MSIAVQKDHEKLKVKLNQRFGLSAMKERYLADAKLWRRLPCKMSPCKILDKLSKIYTEGPFTETKI